MRLALLHRPQCGHSPATNHRARAIALGSAIALRARAIALGPARSRWGPRDPCWRGRDRRRRWSAPLWSWCALTRGNEELLHGKDLPTRRVARPRYFPLARPSPVARALITDLPGPACLEQLNVKGRSSAMKRILIGSMLAVAFAAVTPPLPRHHRRRSSSNSSNSSSRHPTTAKPAEVTLVGCVVKGSAPKTFVFENAVDPARKDDKPRKYLLIAAADMDLTAHANHKIQITGLADTKVVVATPPATVVAEKDLPTFTIKTVTHVADTCSERDGSRSVSFVAVTLGPGSKSLPGLSAFCCGERLWGVRLRASDGGLRLERGDRAEHGLHEILRNLRFVTPAKRGASFDRLAVLRQELVTIGARVEMRLNSAGRPPAARPRCSRAETRIPRGSSRACSLKVRRQDRPQRHARAMQPDFHRVGGRLQRRGAFLRRQTFDVPQQQNGTVGLRQLVDRLSHEFGRFPPRHGVFRLIRSTRRTAR